MTMTPLTRGGGGEGYTDDEEGFLKKNLITNL